MIRRITLLTLAVSAGFATAYGQEAVITSFQGNGTLTWDNAATTGYHTVEWASSPTGTWRQTWSPLVELPAVGGTTTASVPMFLRVIYIPLEAVEDEIIAVADGLSTFYFGHVQHIGLSSNAFSITVPPTYLFTDPEGDGTLAGMPSGSGSIVYGTGAWSLNFSGAQPGSGTVMTASYEYREIQTPTVKDETIGQGDDVETVYSGHLARSNIVVRSVTVIAGSFLFNDLDGNGTLDGQLLGSGTLDYASGAWSLDFGAPALSTGDQIVASYQYQE